MFDAAKRRSAETFVESSEWISALAFNPLSSHPPIQAFKIHCQKNFGEEGRVAFPSYLPYIYRHDCKSFLRSFTCFTFKCRSKLGKGPLRFTILVAFWVNGSSEFQERCRRVEKTRGNVGGHTWLSYNCKVVPLHLFDQNIFPIKLYSSEIFSMLSFRIMQLHEIFSFCNGSKSWLISRSWALTWYKPLCTGKKALTTIVCRLCLWRHFKVCVPLWWLSKSLSLWHIKNYVTCCLILWRAQMHFQY